MHGKVNRLYQLIPDNRKDQDTDKHCYRRQDSLKVAPGVDVAETNCRERGERIVGHFDGLGGN